MSTFFIHAKKRPKAFFVEHQTKLKFMPIQYYFPTATVTVTGPLSSDTI